MSEFENRYCGKEINITGKKGVKDFSREIEKNLRNAKAYYNRGRAYAEMRQLELAVRDYNRAVEISPDFADAYHLRGYANYLNGKYALAAEDYDRALSLSPGQYGDDREGYLDVSISSVETEVAGVIVKGIRRNTAFDMEVIITEPYQNFKSSSHIPIFARNVTKFRGDYAYKREKGILSSIYKTCLYIQENLPDLKSRLKELDEVIEKLKQNGITEEQVKEKRRLLRKKLREGVIDHKVYQNELHKIRKAHQEVVSEIAGLELNFKMNACPPGRGMGGPEILEFLRGGKIIAGYFKFQSGFGK